MKVHASLNAIVLCIVCTTVFVICAERVNPYRDGESGSCGDELTWAYDESSKTLTITGSGDMYDFNSSVPAPWYYPYHASIKTVIFDGAIRKIGSRAFARCTNLTTITIPSTVAYIGSYAFYDCWSLTSIEIPEKVINLEDYTFSGCKSITSIFIPKGILLMGSNVFYECPSLAAINVDESNRFFNGTDGVLFDKERKTLLRYPSARRGDYEIPATVTRISNCAFYQSFYLTNITIPDSVSIIGASAFEYCSALTNVSIPASVQSIGSSIFRFCSSLTWFEVDKTNPLLSSKEGVLLSGGKILAFPSGRSTGIIPDGITSIGNYAFSGSTRFTSVTIPSSVTSIASNSFFQCENIETVSYFGDINPGTSGSSFFECDNLRIICVPIDYDSNAFCGSYSLCLRDSCGELQAEENCCFMAACDLEQWSIVKRENASVWEKKTDSCFEFQCDNITGPLTNSLCSDSEICVNGKCESNDTISDKSWVVILTIEFGKNDMLDLNPANITDSICLYLGADCDKVVMAVDINDGFFIVSAYADNGDLVDVIERAMDSFPCPPNSVCRKRTEHFNMQPEFLSGIERDYVNTLHLIAFALLMMNVVALYL